MADWADVRRLAMALPEVVEWTSGQGTLEWRVKGKTFVAERPLRRGDVEALGADAPSGQIMSAWVPDVGAKEALVAQVDGSYFTTPHFDGYAVVLVRLDEIDGPELEELIVEAWRCRAPKRLGAAHLKDR